jgi:hypothetical protein
MNHAVTCILGIVMFASTACVPQSPDDNEQPPAPGDHTGQTMQALTGNHKICSAIVPSNYRDSIEVDDTWTASTCLSWANSVNAGAPGATWQLGCLFPTSFSWGSQGGGAPPSQSNCGW